MRPARSAAALPCRCFGGRGGYAIKRIIFWGPSRVDGYLHSNEVTARRTVACEYRSEGAAARKQTDKATPGTQGRISVDNSFSLAVWLLRQVSRLGAGVGPRQASSSSLRQASTNDKVHRAFAGPRATSSHGCFLSKGGGILLRRGRYFSKPSRPRLLEHCRRASVRRWAYLDGRGGVESGEEGGSVVEEGGRERTLERAGSIC